jgi:ADP-ribose pyrophosphatase YjhB (NUDIX family)
MKYCNRCGASVILSIPAGDDRPRYTCNSCGTIHYQNPRVVVGCIPEWEDKILFCQRAIEPRYGFWTLPAGFLENGETVSEGAKRETYEEAGAVVHQLEPYGLYNICYVNQIYLMFRGGLVDLTFTPGPESLAVRLFTAEEIPWDELAFPVIGKTLTRYLQDRNHCVYPFHIEDIKRRESLFPDTGANGEGNKGYH